MREKSSGLWTHRTQYFTLGTKLDGELAPLEPKSKKRRSKLASTTQEQSNLTLQEQGCWESRVPTFQSREPDCNNEHMMTYLP